MLILAKLPLYLIPVTIAASFLLGCVVAQRCGQDLGVADHSGINWDEIVAIWLVLWLIPTGFWYQAAGVVLFRFFDILKPYPINIFDTHFKNGFGVMIDDVIAAIYSLLVMHIFILVIGNEYV